MEQRPRPEVTVRDPAHPSARFVPTPLDDEPLPGPHRRRWLALAVALAGAAAAVLVGLGVLEQRRLDGVVDLDLAGPPLPTTTTWSYDRDSGAATRETPLWLRNDGPRSVRLVSARFGDLRFRGDVGLAARTGTAVVVLRSTVRCPGGGQRPPAEPEPDRVELAVVTPAGQRQVVLPTPRRPTTRSALLSAAGACGYPPLEQSVRVAGTARAGETPGTVRVRVQVTHASRRHVRLLSLAFARGLELRTLDGGRTSLPVELARPSLGGASVQRLDALLSISCGAVRATGALPLGTVEALVEDVDDADLAQVSGRIGDTAALRQAVGSTCSSG